MLLASFLGRRLGSRPTSCQVVATVEVEAAALLAVAVIVLVAVLALAAAVVDEAGAPAAAMGRAGNGAPCDSASSRRRVLITPLTYAILCRSEATLACPAVGGGGSTASFTPLGAGGAVRRPLVDGRGQCVCEEGS